FLEAHETANFRVEVVPTINHWEAYYVPAAGVPPSRGGDRPLGHADNPPLYMSVLTSPLDRPRPRSPGIRYVVVPKLPLEAIDGKREARIVRDRATGLRRVWSGFDASIYELPHPTPILTGPGRATITDLDSNRVEGWVARSGRYALRLRFSPYELIRGKVCVSPSKSRLTRLVALQPGRFVIQAIEDPLLVVTTAFENNGTRVC